MYVRICIARCYTHTLKPVVTLTLSRKIWIRGKDLRASVTGSSGCRRDCQVSTEQNCEQGLGNSPPCYMPNGNTETYSPEDMQRMFIAALFIIYHPEKKKEKSAAWKKRVMQSGNRAEVITVNTEEGRQGQEGPSFWWECRWGAASPPKCWFLGMFVWGKPKHLWLTVLSRMLKELPWSL